MKKKTPTIGDCRAGRLDEAVREKFERDLHKKMQNFMQPFIEMHRAWKTEATTFLDFWNEGNVDINQVEKYLTENPLSSGAVAYLVMVAIERDKTATGKRAAKARHSQPGGNHDKRNQIREIWATGKYSSRDVCAEQEYSGQRFGSYKAARNALINTPDPSPWPAKKKNKS